jgi:hypothetical protein
MKLKRIVALRIMTILCIVLLVIFSLIFVYEKIITDLVMLTAVVGVGVAAISSISITIHKIFGDTLKEIDGQLNTVYIPMVHLIDNFKKEKGYDSHSSELIKDTGDLGQAFRELEIKIETETVYKIDIKIRNMKIRFFGTSSNNTDNLRTFLDAIQLKMKELQDEKRKYV